MAVKSEPKVSGNETPPNETLSINIMPVAIAPAASAAMKPVQKLFFRCGYLSFFILHCLLAKKLALSTYYISNGLHAYFVQNLQPDAMLVPSQ